MLFKNCVPFVSFMQVSVGTLLAFTTVAISILILRYVPPDEVPLPASLQEAIDSVSLKYASQQANGEDPEDPGCGCKDAQQTAETHSHSTDGSLAYPLIEKEKCQCTVTLRSLDVSCLFL